MRSHAGLALGLAVLASLVAATTPLSAGLRSGAPATGDLLVDADLRPLPEPLADDPFEAGQLGIDWLAQALCDWMQGTGLATDCTDGAVKTCFGCHVQAETVLGLARSADRCYTLPLTACSLPEDESQLQFAARFVAGTQRKDCIIGRFDPAACGTQVDPTTIDGQPQELGSIGHYEPCGSNSGPASIHPVIQSAHGGLNLAGYTRYISDTYAPNLIALADWFALKQQPEGHWIADRYGPPIDQGESFCTGSASMVMREATRLADPGRAATYAAAIARARLWSETAVHTTTQDRTFAILTLLEAGAAADDPGLLRMRDELLGLQQGDGGWSERVGLTSNAYATGQAVNALIEAGLAVDEPAICSGIGWLVRNQNFDGSWNLGVPGASTDSGSNSLFAATIWPVLALGNLHPFGASLDVESSFRETCADRVVFPVEVRHSADTACGLFARTDTYSVRVSNDRGDTVSVDRGLFDLGGGESIVLFVTWERVGPLPPPGTSSVTSLIIDSVGAQDAGCPVSVEAALTVVVPPDERPGAVSPSLRLAKRGADLFLRWQGLPELLGPYELVNAQRLRRSDESERPTRGLLDSRAGRRRTLGSETEFLLPGEANAGAAELVFYKVRASSACSATPGPTCDFSCADADRCDASCP